MTLTDHDWSEFESAKSLFEPQPTPNHCLPIGLENILSELAESHDEPELCMPRSTLEKITEHDEHLAATSEKVAPVLGAELEQYGYTVKEQINCSQTDLEDVIDKGTASLPLVELDPSYFDLFPEWSPQPGRRGHRWPHVVTPYKINHEEVLYYDPFSAMRVQSGKADTPQENLSQSMFFDLWHDAPTPRWMIWIERMEQQTLDTVFPNGGN